MRMLLCPQSSAYKLQLREAKESKAKQWKTKQHRAKQNKAEQREAKQMQVFGHPRDANIG